MKHFDGEVLTGYNNQTDEDREKIKFAIGQLKILKSDLQTQLDDGWLDNPTDIYSIFETIDAQIEKLRNGDFGFYHCRGLENNINKEEQHD